MTHSILTTGGMPSMTFAEAMQTAQGQNEHMNDSRLGESNFVLWNQPAPPVPTSTGLYYTPP